MDPDKQTDSAPERFTQFCRELGEAFYLMKMWGALPSPDEVRPGALRCDSVNLAVSNIDRSIRLDRRAFEAELDNVGGGLGTDGVAGARDRVEDPLQTEVADNHGHRGG